MNASHLLWRYASLAIDVVVVVLPVPGAGVVGRVDVDAVDLAGVGEPQRLQRVVVLAVDDDVGGLVAAALDAAQRFEAGVDRLAELGHDHQVIHRQGVACSVVGHHGGLAAPDALHLHRSVALVGAAYHFGPAAHGVLGQAHTLGQMRLEHQPEAALGSHLVHCGAQLCAESGISDLLEQYVQLVSHCCVPRTPSKSH